jgi:hypothetical protein
MPHYAAPDVSNQETAILVVDEAGRTVWRGKRRAIRRPSPRLCAVAHPNWSALDWRPASADPNAPTVGRDRPPAASPGEETG